MLQLTPHHKIYLAQQHLDFRKGIDKIVGVCRKLLDCDPFSGHIFVFINKKHTAVKILVYDGQGFWLCMKRLSHGKLKWWPKAKQSVCMLNSTQLQILLHNGNPETAQLSSDWRPLPEPT